MWTIIKNIFMPLFDYLCSLLWSVVSTLTVVHKYDSYGYRKDSMDRFGDDLTELILSYLTFEDKIRLECVSKQWKNAMVTVFKKQLAIKIVYKWEDKHKMFINGLITVLKKCPNIIKVRISTDIEKQLAIRPRIRSPMKSELLSLIGQYCPNIESLTINSEGIENMPFFRHNGAKLEELILCDTDSDIKSYLEQDIEKFKEFLRFLPNLKNFRNFILTEDKEILPKLEKINIWLNIDYQRVNNLKIITVKYSQTMKILKLILSNLTAEELKACIDCISRFENLTFLGLNICKTQQPIDDCLSLIGQKCNKLLKLHLSINSSFSISDRFFDIFTNFKTIKKLKITLKINKALEGSVECFKHCKQLKYLDINFSELKEHFFTNIESFVPKLQSLKISTDKQYSDSFIDSFQSMKSIRRVELVIDGSNNDRYMTWCFGKCLNEIVSSHNGKESIRINDNCGLINYFYVYEDFGHY